MRNQRLGSVVFLRVLVATALVAPTAGCKKAHHGVTPPSGLTYAMNPAVYTRGAQIAANKPSSVGGEVESYSVAPTLPAGLSLNTSTGVITGTPTAMSAPTDFTVTATNRAGSTTATVNVSVNARLDVLFTTDEHSHLFGFAPELDDALRRLPPGSGSSREASCAAQRSSRGSGLRPRPRPRRWSRSPPATSARERSPR